MSWRGCGVWIRQLCGRGIGYWAGRWGGRWGCRRAVRVLERAAEIPTASRTQTDLEPQECVLPR